MPCRKALQVSALKVGAADALPILVNSKTDWL